MKTACLLVLSACVLANASIPINNVFVGDSIKRQLGPLKLKGVAKDPGSEAAVQTVEFDVQKANERNIVADTIEFINEELRNIIVNGNDYVPPLDPLVVDHVGPLLYTATGVRATANAYDIRMEGLQWYVVDQVSFSALRLTFGLQYTVPRLVTHGRYDARATIAIVNHVAGGNFIFFAHRVEFRINMRLGANISDGHLFLRELEVILDIHDTFVEIQGMTGSPLLNSLINSYIQSISQEVIQNELENVSQLISEALFEVVDEFLKDYTLQDILG